MSTQQTAEAGHSTRQLLDELDALMEQMLALPIADPETGDTASNTPEQPATISATLTLLSPEAGAPPSEDTGSCQVSMELKPAAPAVEVVAAPVPLLAEVAAPKTVAPSVLPPPPRTSPWMPNQLSYQFLRWVNQRYDRATTCLGKQGRRLRGRTARTILGLSGLVMLAAALAWLCKDWIGWIW